MEAKRGPAPEGERRQTVRREAAASQQWAAAHQDWPAPAGAPSPSLSSDAASHREADQSWLFDNAIPASMHAQPRAGRNPVIGRGFTARAARA